MSAPKLPPLGEGWAYFLDIDGTLLDLAEHPRAVRVSVALPLLERLLTAAEGAVALISGRSVDDIERLFYPLVFPIAGQHGTERRTAEGLLLRHAPPLEHLGRAASELVRFTAAHTELVVENKGMALALHYRRAPELRDLVEHEMRTLAASLGDAFELQEGKLVFELKPSGKNKGSAIAEFMREAPFAGRLPVFIGDDLTDEHGFEVVNELGGHSVKVGPGPSRARWRLADSSAVREWLAACIGRARVTRRTAAQ
ncbi:MAG TPA: trehalose-phosphatase [Burkholderiales bacterium]|jgi:trehalose 6-phosphate phosphatase|nr:trehalose-phosphatase [Burkholderiales bacterium]